MRGIDRRVAYQRIMNSGPSKTNEQAKLQLPIWKTNVDEYETRYHTKLDTISKVTALKIFISPKVTGEKYTGTGGNWIYHILLDSQMLNGQWQ